jgi:nicotinate-nucleotide adenylyltransferase
VPPMSSTVRRGVFPGSFDPLTVAHVALADAAVDTLGLDRLDLSVSRDALGKPHLDDSLDERVADLRTAVADRPGWGVVVTTSRLLADVADGFDALVLGADKLAQVLDPAWYDGAADRDAAVRRLPTVAVAPRAGQPLEPLLDQARALDLDVVALDVAPHLHEVSATAVRAGRHDWRAVG